MIIEQKRNNFVQNVHYHVCENSNTLEGYKDKQNKNPINV